MNIKRILLAVVVLALTVECTWAATEAGFAVIPDNEAGQIVGGVGYQCTGVQWWEDYWPCGWTGYCDSWVYWFTTYQCAPAISGTCDDSAVVLGAYSGNCAPDPQTGGCSPDGTYWDVLVYGCEP